MKSSKTPPRRPNAKKKQKKTPFVGVAMCEKRSPRSKRRGRQSSSSGSQSTLIDSTSSEAEVNSEDDEATRRKQAFLPGPTITVHTPSAPQQLATMDYTQFPNVWPTSRTSGQYFERSAGISNVWPILRTFGRNFERPQALPFGL